jgi:hypothetical protein
VYVERTLGMDDPVEETREWSVMTHKRADDPSRQAQPITAISSFNFPHSSTFLHLSIMLSNNSKRIHILNT